MNAAERYHDMSLVDSARQFAANALCECATANHITGGIMEATTSDGQKWSIRYEKIEPTLATPNQP